MASQARVVISPCQTARGRGRLSQAVTEAPEVSVVIRGDVRVGYGDVYEVVKTAKNCNVKHLGLVSKEN